jgi:hypothetical protein
MAGVGTGFFIFIPLDVDLHQKDIGVACWIDSLSDNPEERKQLKGLLLMLLLNLSQT